jgi:hypothetical protein
MSASGSALGAIEEFEEGVMFKVKGKKYRRVACKADGKAPKGAIAVTRGKSRRTICAVPAKR